jgi:transcriptional regulator with XRE-family HTH domain
MPARQHPVLMIGKELRAARLTAGMTQETLASKAKLDRSYVSQLERGLKSPTLDTLMRLCKALGVSAAELIGRVETGR